MFVDGDFRAAPDQWRLLSGVTRMSSADVAWVLQKALDGADALGVRIALDDGAEAPWTLPPSGRRPESRIAGPFPTGRSSCRATSCTWARTGLPQGLQDRLIRLAAFENPEFYRAQAMRLPTFAKPRLICCAEEMPGYIALPRGCLDAALDLLAGLRHRAAAP